MIAILNHMPLWAGASVVLAAAVGLGAGIALTRWDDRRHDR